MILKMKRRRCVECGEVKSLHELEWARTLQGKVNYMCKDCYNKLRRKRAK